MMSGLWGGGVKIEVCSGVSALVRVTTQAAIESAPSSLDAVTCTSLLRRCLFLIYEDSTLIKDVRLVGRRPKPYVGQVCHKADVIFLYRSIFTCMSIR